jgi:hypothetical protein
MKRLALSTVCVALTALTAGCADPFRVDSPDRLAADALSAAFTTVPLEYSSVTSSFPGDADGVPSLWLPGPRMRGFDGGLMGGGLGDPYAGRLGAGRGFGHQGPFGGRFAGGVTCSGAFDGASGRFVCDPVTRNGVTITRSIGYTTAAGTVQPAFDTATTNTVNVRSAATGTVTFTRDSTRGRGHGPKHVGHVAGDTSTILTATTTISHAADRTVSGLATGSTQRTVNGTSAGTESTTGTSSRGSFTASRTAADTTKGLVIPIDSGKPTYPTAGTVTRVMTATVSYAGSAPVSTSRKEVITYDGSATAKVVITRNGVTKACSLPLPHGRPVCTS